jgi:hypothetical protein
LNGYMFNISNNITLIMLLFVFIQADASLGASYSPGIITSLAYFYIAAFLCYSLFFSQSCKLNTVDGRTVDLYDYVLFDINFVNVSKGACANLLVFALKMLMFSQISPFIKQTLKSAVYFRWIYGRNLIDQYICKNCCIWIALNLYAILIQSIYWCYFDINHVHASHPPHHLWIAFL